MTTAPKHGSIWQHRKGGVYMVLVECTIEATDTPAVAYKSLTSNGRDDVWIRPLSEFMDGRFKPLDLSIIALADKAQADAQ